MLKGEVFGRQLFENQIFALFINTFLNGNNGVCSDYLNGMAVTYSGNNVTIDSGAVCIQGRFLEEDTSTTLDAGNSNLFCKLVIEIDLDKINTEDSFNQGYYKVVTDSTGYPELTQTNIVGTNSGIYQYELARFKTSTSGITDFQDMRTTLSIPTIYDDIRQMVQDAIDGIEDGSDLAFKDWVGGTVLYESEEGLNQRTPVPLTEAVSNFERIKIFYKNDGNDRQIWNSIEIYDPLGKKCTLEATYQGTSNCYKNTQGITIGENQIQWNNFAGYTINVNGISDYTVNVSGLIRIYKVIGYKY